MPRAEGSERRFVHLYFLDSDPRESFADLFADHGAELEKAGLGHVQLASPFLTTIPGTDMLSATSNTGSVMPVNGFPSAADSGSAKIAIRATAVIRARFPM